MPLHRTGVININFLGCVCTPDLFVTRGATEQQKLGGKDSSVKKPVKKVDRQMSRMLLGAVSGVLYVGPSRYKHVQLIWTRTGTNETRLKQAKAYLNGIHQVWPV